jgi:glycosyltransferase involved in cell wall biosynthesis
MIRLFINALGAKAGGGLTYVRNLLPQLTKRKDVGATVVMNPVLRAELQTFGNIDYLEYQDSSSSLQRFWHEQSRLPGLIQRSGADVLLSTGNFALRNSPVPQILLSRNSLYTSPDFSRDLLARRHYSIWFDTKLKSLLAKNSLQWADCAVAPSTAFAEELQRWGGGKVLAVHHGFDRSTFLSDTTPLPPEVQRKLEVTPDTLRLLFVSHYNYYRNFETLFRALPLIRKKIAPRPVKLFLTCRLRTEANPGSYRAEPAAALVERLVIRDSVVELGSVSYRALHKLYRACDVYVTPAYTETFAHPLVEAMSCGIPIVASDLPVHREVCGAAATYFPTFSESHLAERVSQLVGSSSLRQELTSRGLEQSRCFSWEHHTAEIIGLAEGLVRIAKARAA